MSGKRGRPATDPAILFWAKVDTSGDCWEWTAGKSRAGYGRFGFRGRMHLAHRVAWILEHGEIPEGMMLDHKCHNPACVRLAHLRLATVKQNAENRAGADKGSASGIRGVCFHKKSGKWVALVRSGDKRLYGGLHATKEQAGEAARLLRLKHHTFNDADRIPA